MMGARMDRNVSYFGNIDRKIGSTPPDLSGGACMTPGGIKIMDAYANSFGGRNGEGIPHARDSAKGLCIGCTVRVACRNDTLEVESPLGAWGGMLGAMTPKERRRLKPHYERLKGNRQLRLLDSIQFSRSPARRGDRDGTGQGGTPSASKPCGNETAR